MFNTFVRLHFVLWLGILKIDKQFVPDFPQCLEEMESTFHKRDIPRYDLYDAISQTEDNRLLNWGLNVHTVRKHRTITMKKKHIEN